MQLLPVLKKYNPHQHFPNGPLSVIIATPPGVPPEHSVQVVELVLHLVQ